MRLWPLTIRSRPTFGVPPLVLAGRDAVLEDIGDALATGPSHPDCTSLLIGARGTGKTVVLGEVAGLARRRGWLVLSDNASPSGLLSRLERGAVKLLRSLEDSTPVRRISGVRVGGFGMDFELSPSVGTDHDLRGVLTILGDRLASNGTGLLITIDELQSGDFEEIREFGSVLQLAARVEPKPVAFLGAAIPVIEETLLADVEATFLQRCARHDIGCLDQLATRTALVEPIRMRGASVDAHAISQAVEATSGYAFMVQLVGFHAWKASSGSS